MRRLFETNAEEQPGDESDKSEQLAIKFWKLHAERIESLKKLIAVPAENECTFLWTMNSFNAFTFIPFCLSNFGHIDEITLSTYTVSRRIADALIRQYDAGKISKVNIFVSESLKFRMPQVIDHLDSLLITRPGIRIQYGWNHSKITCVRCGENQLVLEGSGNWGENAQYEQYILTNSKQIYEFRKKNIGIVE
ncbi:MAG TPA: hypothetical protein VK152_00325 [Paludibacter sp.]|nr:hypothetical protein [Paludibacter sp.]